MAAHALVSLKRGRTDPWCFRCIAPGYLPLLQNRSVRACTNEHVTPLLCCPRQAQGLHPSPPIRTRENLRHNPKRLSPPHSAASHRLPAACFPLSALCPLSQALLADRALVASKHLRRRLPFAYHRQNARSKLVCLLPCLRHPFNRSPFHLHHPSDLTLRPRLEWSIGVSMRTIPCFFCAATRQQSATLSIRTSL